MGDIKSFITLLARPALTAFILSAIGLMSAPSAFSQYSYFNTNAGGFWEYNIDTHQMTDFGSTVDDEFGEAVIFADIASNYEGELFGVAYRKATPSGFYLYRILLNEKDHKVNLRRIGPTHLMAIGLVFTPENRLYAAGVHYGAAQNLGLYELNVESGQMVSKLVDLPVQPWGDLTYNTEDQKFYMPTQYPNDGLYEIDLTNPTNLTFRGSVVDNKIWGMDFFGGHLERLVGMSDQQILTMKKVNTDWVVDSILPQTAGECYGGTKYHCSKSNPWIELNSSAEDGVHISCGMPMILSGEKSTKTKQYRWKISRKKSDSDEIEIDESGVPLTVEIEGAGSPGTLDLRNDERFSKLNLGKQEGGFFEAELTTWCDYYETGTKTIHLTFYLDAFTPASAKNWTISTESPAPQPSGKFSNVDFAFYQLTQTQFQGISAAKTEQSSWYVGETNVGSSNPQPYFWEEKDNSDQAGLMHVTREIKNEFGCVARETKTVEILPFTVFVPSSFTPNSDGLNDGIRPFIAPDRYETDVAEVVFQIVNRWGEVVFRSNDLTTRWDGRVNGIFADLGTYYYQLQFRMKNGTPQLLKGDITLVR